MQVSHNYFENAITYFTRRIVRPIHVILTVPYAENTVFRISAFPLIVLMAMLPPS